MELIQATKKDWKILLEWRNDPLARKNSIHTEIIGEKEHKLWFFQSLENPKRNIYLAHIGGEAVGMLRIDDDKGTKITSWSVSPAHRGKGYAKEMLKKHTDNAYGEFKAIIKESNIASIRVAEFAGFSLYKKQNGILTFKKINDEDR